jgi:hypothetical protein
MHADVNPGDLILTTDSYSISENWTNKLAIVKKIDSKDLHLVCLSDPKVKPGRFAIKNQDITWIHIGKPTELHKLIFDIGDE